VEIYVKKQHTHRHGSETIACECCPPAPIDAKYERGGAASRFHAYHTTWQVKWQEGG